MYLDDHFKSDAQLKTETVFREKNMKNLLLTVSLCALAVACGGADREVAVKEPNVTETDAELVSAQLGAFGIDLSARNEAVDPGNDFNAFANGKWLETFEIPADQSRYGAFDRLGDLSEERVRKIIETTAEAEPAADTLEGKIAAVYNAYMDTDAINARGLEPAQPYLDRIAAIESREDLADAFAATGFSSPVGGWVDVDAREPDAYIFYMSQSGLGLPDRDYYLEDSEKNLEIREKYLAYLTFLLEQAGYEDPSAAASEVLQLETKIAMAHWDRTVGRNRSITYNKLSPEELAAMSEGFPVERFLTGLGVEDQASYVVRQILPTDEEIEENGLNEDQLAKLGEGIPGLFALAGSEPLDTWKAWLSARFLSSRSDVLPTEIDDASFDFYGRFLRGTPEQRERWKRAVTATEGAVGEAVGKVYAERYFPKEAKAQMDDLVANLRKAMAMNLDEIEWMGEETKVEARDKLAKFTPKIGYPDKFETYDSLELSPDDAFGNDMAVSKWAYEDMISKLGEPIDKSEWFMLPQTVNAYYSPTRNEIVFPAAILQPPFFDPNADPAVNYGAIGGVIGHEMGHGFDDQGSKSDGDGMLRDWWTAEDQANFQARTNALADQYSAFCPLGEDEICVNGKLRPRREHRRCWRSVHGLYGIQALA